ncbi:MAG TPA: hypothetical protein VGN90_02450 [Pyrinomonadaceae bacterium]|jgi:hypothetical protein|nr:hypothetical protein [Pyrinomonadaceae bacterium]
MDSRYYPGVEADVSKLAAELRNVFDQDYEVQTMHVSSTTVVQARKSSTLRDLTGLSAALTIKVTPEAGGTRVEIGMQKWLDKAAIAALAVLLSAGRWQRCPHSVLTGNIKSLRMPGKLSKTTSRGKRVAMFRRCRDAAVSAAPPTPPMPASAARAAQTLKGWPVDRAGLCRRIRPRVSVINAGSLCLRKGNF